jgi:hypothetical protein
VGLSNPRDRIEPFLPPWARYGRPVEIVFKAAGATVDVPHQLGAVPDGYFLVLATGAVYAANVQTWDKTLAFFTAPAANTVARLIFFTTREGVTRAN